MRLLLFVLAFWINSGGPKAPEQITSTAQLEAAVVKAYSEAPETSFVLDSTWDGQGKRIHAVIVHKSDYSTDLVVSDQDGPLCTFTHSAVNAQGQIEITQHNLRDNKSSSELATLAQVKLDGATYSRVVDACDFGSFIASWVGKDTHFQSLLKTIIFPNASYLGIRNVGAYPCDVISVKRLLFEHERWYFDRKSHLLRRWQYTRDGVHRNKVLTYSSDVKPVFGSGDGLQAKAVSNKKGS